MGQRVVDVFWNEHRLDTITRSYHSPLLELSPNFIRRISVLSFADFRACLRTTLALSSAVAVVIGLPQENWG